MPSIPVLPTPINDAEANNPAREQNNGSVTYRLHHRSSSSNSNSNSNGPDPRLEANSDMDKKDGSCLVSRRQQQTSLPPRDDVNSNEVQSLLRLPTSSSSSPLTTVIAETILKEGSRGLDKEALDRRDIGHSETRSSLATETAVVAESRGEDELDLLPQPIVPQSSNSKSKPPSISITTTHAPSSNIITSYIPYSQTPSPQTSNIPLTKTASNTSTRSLPKMPTSFSKTSNMFFSSAHRRRNMANTNALTHYEADLNNKDRAKQKDAVRRFLEENVEEDWKFDWLQGEEMPARYKKRRRRGDVEKDVLEETGRKAQRWKERDEWLSNTNDSDDDPAMPTAASPDTATPTSEKGGQFRFENADDVGDVVRTRELERKIRRERKLNEELTLNEGLRIFVARRDAWTGARKAKRNERRPSSKTLTNNTNSSHDHEVPATADEAQITTDDHFSSSGEDSYSDTGNFTEIPIAPPLLPPSNPMRASITPVAYPTIYDKVILQNLAPSCPVNLQDILSSCVQGWKRDGEWPPKNGVPEQSMRKVKKDKEKGRKLSVSLQGILGLGRVSSKEGGEVGGKEGKESEQSGIRKGLRMVFGKKDINGAGGQAVVG